MKIELSEDERLTMKEVLHAAMDFCDDQIEKAEFLQSDSRS